MTTGKGEWLLGRGSNYWEGVAKLAAVKGTSYSIATHDGDLVLNYLQLY